MKESERDKEREWSKRKEKGSGERKGEREWRKRHERDMWILMMHVHAS